MPRLQPGPDGAARGPRGVAGPLPGLRARRPRGRHLVRRSGPRPAHAPRPHPLTRTGRTKAPQATPTWHAGLVEDEQPGSAPPQGRLARLWKAADKRHIPLQTILTAVAVVVAVYLAGKLIYRLRDLVLVIVVAGFIAILLNPIVVWLQRHGVP